MARGGEGREREGERLGWVGKSTSRPSEREKREEKRFFDDG